jgi:transposase
MFVRKKRNVSGTVSVQVVEKRRGVYRVVRSFGASRDADVVARLFAHAQAYVNERPKQGKLFATVTAETVAVDRFVDSLQNANIRTVGPELIFGTLFDRVGFNAVRDDLFRHLVIARLAFPLSKLKTVDYLYRFQGVCMSEDVVYRSLDRLHTRHKETVERIAYEYTKNTLGTISVVFYDMTTLYFEAEDEDAFRKIGYSKDGKFDCPQIMLGLLVGEGGYPIGYDLFEGNTYEGKTLVPTLTAIQEKYGFAKPIVVADAGLLSKQNIKELQDNGYTFILGARVKNERDARKAEVLQRAQGMQNGDAFSLKKEDGTRLIVTYSDKRARKDAYNREKGLRKLRKNVERGTLTKAHVNNRGYNRFLMLEGTMTATIDETRVEADRAWDGLKGYVTNTTLTPKRVVEHYSHLWQIENAFRISKTDLKIRPVHHYKRRRIEAHICIAFVAYTIWKELERLLTKNKMEMSVKRAGELTQNMYALEYLPPGGIEYSRRVLGMDEEQQSLSRVIHSA